MDDQRDLQHMEAQKGICVFGLITSNPDVKDFCVQLPAMGLSLMDKNRGLQERQKQHQGIQEMTDYWLQDIASNSVMADRVSDVTVRFNRVTSEFEKGKEDWYALMRQPQAPSLFVCYGNENLGQVRLKADQLRLSAYRMLKVVETSDIFDRPFRELAQKAFTSLAASMKLFENNPSMAFTATVTASEIVEGHFKKPPSAPVTTTVVAAELTRNVNGTTPSEQAEAETASPKAAAARAWTPRIATSNDTLVTSGSVAAMGKLQPIRTDLRSRPTPSYLKMVGDPPADPH